MSSVYLYYADFKTIDKNIRAGFKKNCIVLQNIQKKFEKLNFSRLLIFQNCM